MNVGGHRITNKDLCSAFTDLGFSGVQTYRASGNVLFEDPGESPARVRARIEAGLQSALGYAVPTVLRSCAQVAELAVHRPWTPEQMADTLGKLQVMLLAEPPSPQARSAVLALETPDDRLWLGPTELYWLPRAGVSDSELDHRAVVRWLGVGTVRTVGTLAGIANKCAR